MARRIVFTNRKGGCGKTTTTVNVAAALAHLGYRVLVVDTDPQAHATISLGFSLQTLPGDVAGVMRGRVAPQEAMLTTYVPRLRIIPASRALADLERRYSSDNEARLWLRDRLHTACDDFDFVCFDTPPTTQLLTLSALIAAEDAYIPTQAHFLAIEGMVEIMELIEHVRRYYTPNLQVRGIIPTFYEGPNERIDKILEELREQLGAQLVMKPIRRYDGLAEAPGAGHTIFQHDLRGVGALDYYRVAQQIIRAGR